jgi:hypothetical protein
MESGDKMPTPTYTPLATVTLTSSVSSVTFSNIPATYRDLILVASAKYSGSATNRGSAMRVNGITSSDYSNVRTDNGASAGGTDNNIPLIGESNTNFATHIIQFMDYSATDKHKSILFRSSTDGARVAMVAARVATTNAITSIALWPPDNFITPGDPDQWASGSSFSLFGIEA